LYKDKQYHQKLHSLYDLPVNLDKPKRGKKNKKKAMIIWQYFSLWLTVYFFPETITSWYHIKNNLLLRRSGRLLPAL